MYKEIKIPFDKEVYLSSYLWDDVINPDGIILISHGMGDHATRYDQFAKLLNANQFIVICSDQYGHGKSIENGKKVGVIEKYDFVDAIKKSITSTYQFIKDQYPNLPIILFAHSMGSMIAQEYIEENPDFFSKVILSGTDVGNFKYLFLKKLSILLSKNKGPIHYSNLINRLTLGSFNHFFKKEKLKNAWLTHDRAQIKKYNLDALCGGDYPLNYYISLANSLRKSFQEKEIKKIKAEEVLILCGSEDPVSNFGKSSNALNKIYQKNLIHSSCHVIPNARHECFNEIDEYKNEFNEQILKFIQKEKEIA